METKYDDIIFTRVKSSLEPWPLMSSIYPVIALTSLYLLFVTKFGPNFTKHRKPMELTGLILLYNSTLVAFSVWWLLKMVTNWKAMVYIFKSIFQPNSFEVDEVIEKQIDELVYYYLLSKYVEFLDTVFFVLRQKWNQVTFLHVYHHANMAVVTWLYLKYIWGRHIVVISIVNTFIHSVMYSYYLLAALGPSVRPYLWWKRYITRMQLGQFIILLTHVAILWYNKFPVQKTFMYVTTINVSSFLLLFLDFYRKAYTSKRNNDADSKSRTRESKDNLSREHTKKA